MKKVAMILIILVGVVFWIINLIFLILAFQLFVIYPKHENQTKALLEQKISTLPVPNSCKESKREYTSGSLDVVSNWSLTYECYTTGGAAYDSIVPLLKTRGYRVLSDYSIDTSEEKASSYNFTYSDNLSVVDYEFLPHPEYSDSQPLPSTHIDKIYLSVTRSD